MRLLNVSFLGQLPTNEFVGLQGVGLPTRNERVKRETRVAKVGPRLSPRGSRPKATEPSGRGSPRHVGGASLTPNPCDGQPRRDAYTPQGGLSQVRQPQVAVPILGQDGRPLMPTTSSRARRPRS